MANKAGRGIYSITVEPYELNNLIQILNSLPKETQQVVREKALPLSQRLAGQLMMAADGAPSPQAQLVKQSILAKKDRLIRVDIGGSKKVGRKYGGQTSKSGKGKVKQNRAPAGALLWGSEYGSHSGIDSIGRAYTNRFKAATNAGGYWIRPTVDDYTPIVAKEYIAMIKGVINDLRLI